MTLAERIELQSVGPAAFTKLISSIYAMAPDNPFELPVAQRRDTSPFDRHPRQPVTALADLDASTRDEWLAAYGL